MSREEIIRALRICLLNAGLKHVMRSPVRLEVYGYRNTYIGEVFFVSDGIDGMIFTANGEYGDLFEGITNGLRVGWKVAKGVLPIEA